MVAPDVARRVGSRVAGKYDLVRVLGQGGSGAVYEARHVRTGARCALKILHPAAGSDGEARMLREARALARLSHPNIVGLVDLEVCDEGVVLVEDLLEGRTLRALLDEELVLAPDRALALLLPVLRALGHAHARGVVHRDVKPENVVLREGERGDVSATLVDFDLAPDPEDPPAHSPRRGLAGTPRYMSPEQACGREDVDARSDLWSFGAVLYECLAGATPHAGGGDRALLEAIVASDPPHLRAAAVGVDDDLADAVMLALVRAPEARCPSAAALERALLGARIPPPKVAPPSARSRTALARPLALVAVAVAVAVALAVGFAAAGHRPAAHNAAHNAAHDAAHGAARAREAIVAPPPSVPAPPSPPPSAGAARDAGAPWYRRPRRSRGAPVERGANAAPIVDDL